MKGVKFDDWLKKQLKNKKFREAYEEEGVYAELAIQIAKLHEKQGLNKS